MAFDFKVQGVPTINEETCTGCGLCVKTCPDRVFELKDAKPRVGRGVFLGCIACGHCVAVCPTGSISVEGRGMKSDDRIELPPASQRATADQLEALLLRRRSMRKFKEDVPDRATIDKILEMTAAAPVGIPPSDVGVVVFHGRERVRAFVENAQETFERMLRAFNPVMMTFLRLVSGREHCKVIRDFVKPLLEVLVEARKQGEDVFAYDAPVLFLFHYGAAGGPENANIAAAYASLAAESLGLGSCMLGTTEVFNHDKSIKAKIGVPPENKVGLGLAMGYPAIKYSAGVRRRLGDVKFA
ncbi:MAG: nitroreductase family protein [Pirellulales bacterium]|nr:nitroreductase family protein [Pirellulales bacterium]